MVATVCRCDSGGELNRHLPPAMRGLELDAFASRDRLRICMISKAELGPDLIQLRTRVAGRGQVCGCVWAGCQEHAPPESARR